MSAVGMLLFGCSGGGSSSVNCSTGLVASSFTYTTQWITGSTGDSQVVTLYRSNGSQEGTRILNRASGSNSFQLLGINSGTYRVVATLFSGTSGGGTELGKIESVVDVCQDTRFRSATAGTPASIKVTPVSVSLLTNGSYHFAANLADASGAALFNTSGNVTWQVNGGVGTIDSNGVFLASAAGDGAVRATDGPTTLFSNSTLHVSDPVITHSKWTVLVYLNAANDLYSFSDLNVNQMESVASSDVRFVVQWKQSRSLYPTSSFDGTRRLNLVHDTTSSVVSPVVQDLGSGVDMGIPSTLNDFVAWGKQYYPADHYVLVIWNHGNGWLRSETTRAVSYDDETGHAIQIQQLPTALTGQTFDIIAFDASLMQMQEVAYEIRNYASFVAGSEESPPGEGYPYDAVFAPFVASPTDTARNLSKGFVDGMVNNPAYSTRKITQSVLDTAQLGNLMSSISLLANRMVQYKAQLTTIVPAVRAAAQSYSPTSVRTFRDLWDLCDRIKADAGTPSLVKVECNNVQTAISNAVVWEGHNSHSPGSHGVSIDFSNASNFSFLSSDYSQMAFAQDSTWDDWLTVAP